jgi:choice-of-anchor A domain-containing protein
VLVSPANRTPGSHPITGNLFYGTSATGISSATGQVTGSITENQALLTMAATDARDASSTFAGLPSTLPNTSMSGTTTINLAPGVNVADLTGGINLGGSDVLTLNGPAGSEIILNTGSLTLNSGRIVLTGGLTPGDVVFNLTGTSAVATSGGLNQESVLTGIVLAPLAQVHLTPGAVTGEIIAGDNINIASGGSIKGVPEPSPMAFFGVGAIGLMGVMVVRHRRYHRTRA